MHHLVHDVIEFIRAHSAWSLPVMFVVAFGESFVGLSLLFPGTTIMVVAGTLVPSGALTIWPLVIGAISGAVLGDAISFWLGRRFGHVVENYWYFRRRPEILQRGFAFFERYGMASVFVGRFFGPVRAVIPLVAGIMEMPWRQFWIANVGSALVWGPALLLPGALAVAATTAAGFTHEWKLMLSVALAVLGVGTVWLLERYGIFERLWKRWTKYRSSK